MNLKTAFVFIVVIGTMIAGINFLASMSDEEVGPEGVNLDKYDVVGETDNGIPIRASSESDAVSAKNFSVSTNLTDELDEEKIHVVGVHKMAFDRPSYGVAFELMSPNESCKGVEMSFEEIHLEDGTVITDSDRHYEAIFFQEGEGALTVIPDTLPENSNMTDVKHIEFRLEPIDVSYTQCDGWKERRNVTTPDWMD